MAPISKHARNSLILKISNSNRKRHERQQKILLGLYQQQRILKVMAFARPVSSFQAARKYCEQILIMQKITGESWMDGEYMLFIE